MIIDWVATGCGWLGTYCVGSCDKKIIKTIGWISWLTATAIWAYVGFTTGITGLMVGNLGYLIFESMGLIKSLRKEK